MIFVLAIVEKSLESKLLIEARSALAAGRYEQAQSAAAQAVQAAESAQRWPEAAVAWHLWGHVLFRAGRFPALLEGWNEQALSLLPPRERVEVHRWAALAACECEWIDVALQHAKMACAVADAAGVEAAPALQALGLACLAVCFDRMGDPWQAERLLQKAIDAAVVADDTFVRMLALNSLGAMLINIFHLLREDEPDEARHALGPARHALEAAHALALAQGDGFAVGVIEGNLGEALVHAAELEQADHWLTRAERGANWDAPSAWQLRALCSRGDWYLARGEPALARDLMQRVEAVVSHASSSPTLIRLHQVLYEANLQLGDAAGALEHLTHFHKLYRRRATKQLKAQSRMLVSRMEVESALQEAERQRHRAAAMESHALHDPLTGIGNRRLVARDLPALMSERAQHQRPVTIGLLDIDHFKTINDRFGHAVGDKVLVELAEVMRRSTRAVDMLARVGGEEFLLVMPDTGISSALEVCQRLRAAGQAVAWGDLAAGLTVTWSVGLAEAPPYDHDLLVARAYAALYQAKAAGRDRVMVG